MQQDIMLQWGHGGSASAATGGGPPGIAAVETDGQSYERFVVGRAERVRQRYDVGRTRRLRRRPPRSRLGGGRLGVRGDDRRRRDGAFRTGHFYGMTTHSRGGLFLEPQARAIIDMGALHTRAVAMDERGKVLGYRMTSQCASGSGQFLENIARYLGG